MADPSKKLLHRSLQSGTTNLKSNLHVKNKMSGIFSNNSTSATSGLRPGSNQGTNGAQKSAGKPMKAKPKSKPRQKSNPMDIDHAAAARKFLMKNNLASISNRLQNNHASGNGFSGLSSKKNGSNGMDEDDDDDDDGDEEEDSPVPSRRTLPSRRNRGAKMMEQIKNIDNEDFWKGKELFEMDEENEMDYETESDEEDVVDSDFDESESEESESEVKVSKEKTKKRSAYLDPAKRPNKKRLALGAPTAATGGLTLQADQSSSSNMKTKSSLLSLERRKSSRASTIESTAEMKRREAEAAKKVKKKSSRKQHRVLTQEEQLEEAKKTEQLNRDSLIRLLEYEEEIKKIEKQNKKPKYLGPRIVFHSKKGEADTVTFTHGDFTIYEKPIPKRQIHQPHSGEKTANGDKKISSSLRCCITGLPARYRDPATKLPYANTAAYQQLRHVRATNPKQLLNLAKKSGTMLDSKFPQHS